MKADRLIEIIRCGETTAVQFKQEFTSQKKIANEMVAMANAKGGMMIFGVEDKTGEIVGLSYEQLQRTSSELGNTANECVRPTIYITTEVVKIDDKHLLVCNIAEGANKPYKNLDGEIFVKQGADKRRVTENSEILSLFQQSQKYFPDQDGVIDSSAEDIDTLALDRFFANVYKKRIEDFDIPVEKLLHNIHITDGKGRLTLAGVLFFARFPQQFRPIDVIKAVRFVGNEATTMEYADSKDIEGTIPEMFEQAMMWLKSCLHSVQDGQSVNSIGRLEIPEIILEELLQNSLVHRDLLKPAAIRLLVFDNRIEIINPGCLAGGLTVDEILLGNSFARNPLIANFCSKTMTYRGLGFGIPRSQEFDVKVEFVNDFSGNQFTAKVWRPEKPASFTKDFTKENITQLSERQREIIEMLKAEPTLTSQKISQKISQKNAASPRTIISDMKVLQEKGLIMRKGGRKDGIWEVK